MTRANARELAVHLIYSREFTQEEPQQEVATRLEKEYYAKLAEENQVYAERPCRYQMPYIDSVVTGVANRIDELNEKIQQFSIGWDVSRISRLARSIMQLAIFEIALLPVHIMLEFELYTVTLSHNNLQKEHQASKNNLTKSAPSNYLYHGMLELFHGEL